MFIIKYRKIWYIFSSLIVIISLFSIFNFGLKSGIDFTGGSLLEMEYAARPEISVIKQEVDKMNFGDAIIQPSGTSNAIIRMRTLSEEEHQKVLSAIAKAGQGKEIRFDSIGPVIGQEMKNKSITAIILVVVMIVLYIAFAFRKVSKPVNSFYYGLTAIIALLHDVILPTGVFAVLGHYYGIEVDVLFITAILTVLGFSVHDTIVVFDRVRENLKNDGGKNNFENIVGESIKQTLNRSINTSLTVIIVLLAIFFLGGDSTKYFSLTLLIGVSVGTYSSIFLASPMLVTWQKIRSIKS